MSPFWTLIAESVMAHEYATGHVMFCDPATLANDTPVHVDHCLNCEWFTWRAR